MNILLRYSLGFDLWILGLLLQVFHCVFLVQSSLDYNARYSTTSMPVITRSKSRLATDSSKELSTANSSNSSKEFLDSTSNQSTTHPSQTNFFFTTIDSSTTSRFLEQTSSSHLSLSSLPRYHDVSEDQFQNSNLEFRNFEIPMENIVFSSYQATPILHYFQKWKRTVRMFHRT